MFGDADAVRAGCVHDENPARAGGGHVNVVDAGAGPRDDPRRGRGGDQLRGRLRRASNHQAVGVGQIGGAIADAAATCVNYPPRFGAEQSSAESRYVSETMIFIEER